MAGYFNASSKLEQFLTEYNDEFDKQEEIENRINQVLEFIKLKWKAMILAISLLDA